jgi:hypothetical protein
VKAWSINWLHTSLKRMPGRGDIPARSVSDAALPGFFTANDAKSAKGRSVSLVTPV